MSINYTQNKKHISDNVNAVKTLKDKTFINKYFIRV